MKILDPGHSFELDSYDGDAVQRLDFVKREGSGYPENIGRRPGTTMQEVIRAILNRANYVNKQTPCLETEGVIQCQQQSILLLETRAKRVKGKFLTVPSIEELLEYSTCKTCGHVCCTEPHAH